MRSAELGGEGSKRDSFLFGRPSRLRAWRRFPRSDSVAGLRPPVFRPLPIQSFPSVLHADRCSLHLKFWSWSFERFAARSFSLGRSDPPGTFSSDYWLALPSAATLGDDWRLVAPARALVSPSELHDRPPSILVTKFDVVTFVVTGPAVGYIQPHPGTTRSGRLKLRFSAVKVVNC
jgi:hypothetical protein